MHLSFPPSSLPPQRQTANFLPLYTLVTLDVFFLENHGNTHAFKLTNILKAVDCVSGKTADAFDEDKVNIAFFAKLDHLVKGGAILGLGAGKPFIRKDSDHMPGRI